MVERRALAAAAFPWSRSTITRGGRLVLTAALVLFVLGGVCDPPPPKTCDPGGPATSGAQVHDICTFVECVNANLKKAEAHTIADTVQCLPAKCCITLTMSDTSAQKGCFEPADPDDPAVPRCQLPRVLLTCPGPPQFLPSYLLCPTDSESEGVLGSNRVEIGQGVDDMGNMRMADVPIPPGPYTPLDPDEVVSHTTGNGSGTKGCNDTSIGCHATQPSLPAAPNEQLSKPIDPFDNAACIIATDCCGKTAIEKPSTCNGSAVTAQSLSQICECIEAGVNEDGHPLDSDQGRIVLDLCRALASYQSARGACSTAGCPPATGPECHEPGAPCNPATGESVPSSGYHCQAVDEDVFQCIADCPCREYGFVGGGKFLASGAEVSMLRLQLSGLVATADPGSFADSVGVSGELSAFDYLSRTLIDAVSFSSFKATVSGGDFSATGKGNGLVNGVPTNIEFAADRTGGVTTFEVHDAVTSAFLAGGTGEDGRATFALTVTP